MRSVISLAFQEVVFLRDGSGGAPGGRGACDVTAAQQLALDGDTARCVCVCVCVCVLRARARA